MDWKHPQNRDEYKYLYILKGVRDGGKISVLRTPHPSFLITEVEMLTLGFCLLQRVENYPKILDWELNMTKFESKKSAGWKKPFRMAKEEIFSNLWKKEGSSLFLGKYSLSEVERVLEKRNFFKDARKRGLWPLEYCLDSSEYPLQRFQIFYKKKKPQNLVVDLKIKEGKPDSEKSLSLPAWFFSYKFLILEWLTLQNPIQSFSPPKPPLPGQEHPGLSLGKKVFDLFLYLARLNKDDGLLAFPAYFHNALLFLRYFHFFNPEKQGEVEAIRKNFSGIPFKKMAWVVYLNCLKENRGKPFQWSAEVQVHPLHKRLKRYFDSKEYKERVKKSRKQKKYYIDWDCYKKKVEKAQF